jgi:ribonuclease HI
LLAVGVDSKLSLAVGNLFLQSEDAIKVLGVVIDKRISWAPHVDGVVARGGAAVSRVVRSLRGFRARDLAWAVRAFALPILDWGVQITVGAERRTDLRWERAYNRAARLVSGEESSARARERLAWPLWKDRVDATRARFVMNIWEDGVPSVLRDLLPSRDMVGAETSTRLRERGYVPVPDVRTRAGRRAFRYWGAETVAGVLRAPPRTPDLTPPLLSMQLARREADSPRKRTYLAHLRMIYAGKETTQFEGRQVVWTDGSAGAGGAGAAAFYGDGNARNAAIKVPGLPTAQRAELAAILYVLLNDPRPLDIRSDSLNTVRGAQEWRRRWRRNAWYSKPSLAVPVPNVDLWHKLDKVMEFAERTPVTFTWVRGHAGLPEVAACLTTELDIWGNMAADTLAKRAVALARVMDVCVPNVWAG